MKKTITIAILILSINCIAQTSPFIGISIHSKGHSLQVGAKFKDVVAIAGYSKPLTSAVNPTLAFATIGYELNLGNRETDIFALTVSSGVSSYSYLEINEGHEDIDRKGIAPIASVELSKDYYKGRLFVTANYCLSFFAGAGFKIFF
jgi:hypothetical protein